MNTMAAFGGEMEALAARKWLGAVMGCERETFSVNEEEEGAFAFNVLFHYY